MLAEQVRVTQSADPNQRVEAIAKDYAYPQQRPEGALGGANT